jgi:tRNA(Ile)-lysidine synthase TilS/MesJ
MASVITVEQLAKMVCRALDIPAKDNVENLSEILRPALSKTRDEAIGAAKAVSLEIAEDEAERCRSVGATVAQQTALTIAARIRKRHVEVRS